MIDPSRRLHERHAVTHLDLPLGSIQIVVVAPAEQHPVVGVRRTAVRVFVDVVDLAPCGRNRTAWNDATAVADADRSTLMRAEQAFPRAEVDDSARLIEHHLLHRAGARDSMRDRRRYRDVDSLNIGDAAV